MDFYPRGTGQKFYSDVGRRRERETFRQLLKANREDLIVSFRANPITPALRARYYQYRDWIVLTVRLSDFTVRWNGEGQCHCVTAGPVFTQQSRRGHTSLTFSASLHGSVNVTKVYATGEAWFGVG